MTEWRVDDPPGTYWLDRVQNVVPDYLRGLKTKAVVYRMLMQSTRRQFDDIMALRAEERSIDGLDQWLCRRLAILKATHFKLQLLLDEHLEELRQKAIDAAEALKAARENGEEHLEELELHALRAAQVLKRAEEKAESPRQNASDAQKATEQVAACTCTSIEVRCAFCREVWKATPRSLSCARHGEKERMRPGDIRCPFCHR